MTLGAITGAWAKSGAPLPYDAEVEFLQSTGTQYVDADFYNDNLSGFKIDCEVVENGYSSTNPNNRIIGVGSVPRFCFSVSTTDANTFFGFDIAYRTPKRQLGERLVAFLNYKNDRKLKINDTVYSSSLAATRQSRYSSFIFMHNVNGSPMTAQPTKAKVYSVEFTQGTEVVKRLIPVRKGQVGYFYDPYSGKLFGNKALGADAFIIGSDKV